MTKTISLRQKVFNYLDKNPTADRSKTIEAFKTYSANSVRTYFTQYFKILSDKNISDISSQKRSDPIQGKTTIPPLLTPDGSDHPYIDDPDELLYSVSIRELNKPNPDARWATILLQAKKQNITQKGDDTQLQRQSISTLVSKLKEKLPDDVKEETLPPSGNLQKA